MASYKLNPDMERQALRQMVADPSVLPKIYRHLRAPGFDDPLVQLMVAAALAYFKKTGTSPTAVALLQEVREGTNAGKYPLARVTECAELLDEATNLPPLSSDYVVSKIMTSEREDAICAAVEKSMKLVTAGKHDDVFAEIEKAHLIGRSSDSPGVHYGPTLGVRTAKRQRYKAPARWGTGIVELDDITRGGLSVDNPLGLLLAGPKMGKSMAMNQIVGHTAAIGGSALVFSLEEMGEDEWINRIDAWVTDTAIDELHAKADEVRAKVDAWLAKTGGSIHVKAMPSGSSVRDLEAYAQQLRVEDGFVPNVIVVDYPDHMKANDASKYEKRHEELNAILVEIRGFFRKIGCVGWAPTQITAAALEKKQPALNDIAGAFAKAFTADLIVCLMRTAEEKADNMVRFGVLASRFSPDGIPTGQLPSAYAMGQVVLRSHTAQPENPF